jgi:hypothetical protein
MTLLAILWIPAKFLLDARNVSATVIWLYPIDRLRRGSEDIYTSWSDWCESVTQRIVLFKFLIAILKWNEYNKADTPVD